MGHRPSEPGYSPKVRHRAAAWCGLGSVLLLALAGCGGGSGGGDSGGGSAGNANLPLFPVGLPYNPSPDAGYCAVRDQATVPSSFATGEYYGSFGLTQIGARQAYERTGAEGCGVTVAVFDTGVYLRNPSGQAVIHSDLAGGKVVHDAMHEFHRTSAGLFPLNLPSTVFSVNRHGTGVASIAVGNRDGQGVHGVAPGAYLVSLAIRLGSGSGTYTPITVDALQVSASGFNFYFSSLLQTEADVINASFGHSGLVHTYDTAAVRSATGPLWRTLAQQSRSAADRTVIVFGAGNSHGDLQPPDNTVVNAISPEILSGLPYHVPELRGHFLTVVALKPNGAIADYSNRCGVAKAFCLAAPGNAGLRMVVDGISYTQRIASFDSFGREGFLSYPRGTSYSAPLVSGAFAVLKSAFPGTGNTELVARLLATADKTGIYANSDIYGQGALDLDAATRPVGTLGWRFGNSLSGAHAHALDGTLTAPQSLGDALYRLSDRPVTVYDELNAPFEMPFGRALGDRRTAGRMWPQRQSAGALRHRSARALLPAGNGYVVSYTDWNGSGRFGGMSWHQEDGRAWFAFGAGAAPWWNDAQTVSASYAGQAEFFNPYSGMARHGVSAGRFWPLPVSGWRGQLSLYANPRRAGELTGTTGNGSVAWQAGLGYRGVGSVLDPAAGVEWQLGLQTGKLLERRRWLDGEGGGAFDVNEAHTRFIGLSADRRGRRWAWRIAAYRGWTSVSGGGQGLLAGTGGLRSRVVIAGVGRLHVWRPGDRLGLRFFEPMRVDGGRLHVDLPSGRDRYGRLYYDAISLSAAPSGRTRDISIGYTTAPDRGMSRTGHWSVRQGLRLEPGQDASAASQWYASISWRLNF